LLWPVPSAVDNADCTRDRRRSAGVAPVRCATEWGRGKVLLTLPRAVWLSTALIRVCASGSRSANMQKWSYAWWRVGAARRTKSHICLVSEHQRFAEPATSSSRTG